ncbi:MAG: lactate utilization protein C [Kiloniellales bacterium]|nr:lactate utilization protein C [Kiloniellales bacterium]
MTSARDQVLGSIQRSLKRGPLDETKRAALEKRLENPPRGPEPARARLDHADQVDLFVTQAEEVAATVDRVDELGAVPEALARYLKDQNLPAHVRMAPNPLLAELAWDEQPLLTIETGIAQASDEVSLTGAFAGVAETGTLMLLSGPQGPVTLNFLPDNHVVVLKASQIVGPYEDAWARLRAAQANGTLPRTVNFITGPSRTADIEQTIQLGAHGPRRLHIILVEDGDGDGEAAP